MTAIVKLRVQFTGIRGGTCYPGETISVDAETARRLIENGGAVAVLGPDRPMAKRETKPITDTPALTGFAKLHWLRRRIREHGVKPTGTTIVAMTDQLRTLTG